MYKNLTITSLLGMLAIVLGAFGAHALKASLTAEAMQSFETAVRYQIHHVLALLFLNTYNEISAKTKNQISYLFFIGITFFSGSIYTIYLLGVPAKTIWFITPLGGILLIAGWMLLTFQFLKKVIKNK